MSKANSVLAYEGAKGHHTVVPKHCGPLPPFPPYSAFRSERFMSEADSVLAYEGAKGHHTVAEEEETAATDANAEDADADEADAFQPAHCNVAFGSAHDGWAFRLDQFAAMYAERLGCRPEALTRALWGDWSYSAKEKRVVRIK